MEYSCCVPIYSQELAHIHKIDAHRLGRRNTILPHRLGQVALFSLSPRNPIPPPGAIPECSFISEAHLHRCRNAMRLLQGKVFVDNREDALALALEWTDQSGTIWTDGSRLEHGQVGAAAVWWEEGRWRGSGTFLGTNKEVFDAEVFAILQVIKLLNARGEYGRDYTIFSDSQAAVARVQHTDCGPTQALVSAVVDFSHEIRGRGDSVTVRWTPAHQGVDGNEQADAWAKRAAEKREGRADPTYLGELSHF